MTPSLLHPILMPYIDCAEMTRQAVEDCMAQRLDPPPTLLLIDNGSQEEGRALADDLAAAHPGRILVWHHDPPFPSLSAVWNRALRFCWEAGATEAWAVNNDVRLHQDTYAVLLNAMTVARAWFVTGVSVKEGQFDPTMDLWAAPGTPTPSRDDGIRPEGFHYGGPDFSCCLIRKECHRWFQFDEGFVPAYHEDNDFHRRLQLAGFGERIYGLNIPFLHYGSATVNRSPDIRAQWQPRFAACQRYYVEKWGGLPGSETFTFPFNQSLPPVLQDAVLGFADPRVLYLGQGKPPYQVTSWPFDAPTPSPTI